MLADADQQTIDQQPATEDGWELINDQYEIIWCSGLQLPDTLVPERVDAQCEDDDSDVVLSSDDEHGELSSENDDDDAGDDYLIGSGKSLPIMSFRPSMLFSVHYNCNAQQHI